VTFHLSLEMIECFLEWVEALTGRSHIRRPDARSGSPERNHCPSFHASHAEQQEE